MLHGARLDAPFPMGHPVHSDAMSQPASLPAQPGGSPAARKAAAPYAAASRRYMQTLSATSVGLELAVAVILGLFFGMWLDGQLGTAPWMMIAWLVFGFAAGIRGVLRHVRAADRMADELAAEAAGEAAASSPARATPPTTTAERA